MSDLITRRRAVTTTQGSEPPTQLTAAATAAASAATAPALMDRLAVGPAGPRRLPHQRHQWRSLLAPGGVIGPPAPPTPHPLMRRSQPAKKNTRGPCRQLKTAKVTRVTNSRINIGYDERHRAAPTAELHSSLAHDIGHVIRSYCPMQWKSWKVMPDETKTEVRGQLSTNYNLEDLDEESLAYVNRLFSERYKQWKSDLHHHFEAFDDPQVALQEGCPKELEGRRINKGNRKKKTLLHHSGSRPFSYRMDARVREVQIPRDRHDDGGEEPVGSSGVCLPTSSRYSARVCDPPQDAGFQILTETLDQTLGRRPGTYCRGMGNARRRNPTPFISAVKQSGHCFDSRGGHSSEPDVGHSGSPRTIRHSSPKFLMCRPPARPSRASPPDAGPCKSPDL
ncbi:hypothetical protein Prudu_563S000200 [Prunus dulcis]|uniref:Ankyrin repeat family protein n=1 Tax=Prunus dulcis TaxID=3755 RepID=A0A5H2XKR2_PRUDU|nr:hypothetical protein Prudu_563S000200 [Prunus dulcis]